MNKWQLMLTGNSRLNGSYVVESGRSPNSIGDRSFGRSGQADNIYQMLFSVVCSYRLPGVSDAPLELLNNAGCVKVDEPRKHCDKAVLLQIPLELRSNYPAINGQRWSRIIGKLHRRPLPMPYEKRSTRRVPELIRSQWLWPEKQNRCRLWDDRQWQARAHAPGRPVR